MRQKELNMFLAQADAICLTTNPITKSNGAVVMGRGNALYARRCWYGIDKLLGTRLKKYDGQPKVICLTKRTEKGISYLPLPREKEPLLVPVPWDVVSFPVKRHWREAADLALIEQSCKQLLRLIEKKNWKRVLLPRPGCSNGKLSWKKQVKPILNKYFASNPWIVVVYQPDEPTQEFRHGKAESNEEG